MHSWYWEPGGIAARPAQTIFSMSVSKKASEYIAPTKYPPEGVAERDGRAGQPGGDQARLHPVEVLGPRQPPDLRLLGRHEGNEDQRQNREERGPLHRKIPQRSRKNRWASRDARPTLLLTTHYSALP